MARDGKSSVLFLAFLAIEVVNGMLCKNSLL